MAFPDRTTVRSYAGGAIPSYLAGSLGSSYTSGQTFTVANTTTWYEITASGTTSSTALGNLGPFVLVVDYGLSTEEKILCSGEITPGTNTTITVWSDGTNNGRGYDGTSPVSHLAGTSTDYNVFPVATATEQLQFNETVATAITSTTNATGDVTGTYPTLTLQPVSVSGAYGSSSTTPLIDIDGKGRTLSITPTTIQISESQVTGLTVDLQTLYTNISGVNTTLSSEINTISGEVSVLSGNISTISGQVTLNTANIATLSSEYSATSLAISSISGSLALISGNLVTDEANIATNTTNIAALSGSVGTISGQVSFLVPSLATVSGNLVSLTGSVSSISGSLGSLTSSVSTISGQVVTNTNSISLLASEISTISGEVTVLSGNISVISGSLVSLTNSVSTISGEVTLLSGSVSVISGSVVSNKNSIATISGEVTLLSGSITAISGSLTTDIANLAVLSGNVSTISGSLVSLTSSVSSISGSLTSLVSSVSSISGSLSTDQNSLATLSGNVSVISGSLVTTTNNLATLSGNVSVISGSLVTTTSNLATLSGNVSVISGQVTTNANNIASLSGSLALVSGNLAIDQASIAALSGSVSTISGTLSKAVLSGSTAGGDLSGYYPNPTVAKIQGTAVSSVAPTNNQLLRYNTASGMYTPQTSTLLIPTAVLSGNYTANANDYVVMNALTAPVTVTLPHAPANDTVVAVGSLITSNYNVTVVASGTDTIPTASNNVVLGTVTDVFNSVSFVYSAANTTWLINSNQFGEIAGGDLSGNFPNPTVTAIQGVSVSSMAPTTGEVLMSIGGVWTPASGVAGAPGPGGAVGYYGAFYTNNTITTVSANVNYPLITDQTYIANGMTTTSSGHITFGYTGTYNIQFSAQASTTDSNSDTVNIWLRKNGVDIPYTTSMFAIPGTSHGGTGSIDCVSDFNLSVNANDYIEFWYNASSASVSFPTQASSSSPVYPESPAVYITVQQIMYNQTGTYTVSTATASGTSQTNGPTLVGSTWAAVNGATATSNGGTGTGVTLPVPSYQGQWIKVNNDSSNWLIVYPQVSGTIDGSTVNAPTWVPPNSAWTATAETTLDWETEVFTLVSPSLSVNYQTAPGQISLGLPAVGTPGTYGASNQVPVLTTDTNGRVSAVTNTLISGTVGPLVTSGNLTVSGSLTVSGTISVGSNKVTNLAAGSASTDAVNYGQYQTLSGSVATISGSLTTLISNVGTISGSLVTNQTNIAALSGSVSAISGSLTTLTASVASISGSLTTTNSNLATLSGNVSVISGSLVTTTNNLATLSGNVSTISGSLVTTNSNLAALSGSVSSISGSLSTTNSNVATISGRFSSYLPLTGGTVGPLTISGTTVISGYVLISGGVPYSTPSASGLLSLGGLTYTDVNIIQSLSTNVNNYNQMILQNTSSGTSASANLNISNNLATSGTYFGEFGINSSTFSGTGQFSAPNAVYLASATSDLAIGTYSANNIHFVVSGGPNDSITITSGGATIVNGALTASGGLSLYGSLGGVVPTSGQVASFNGTQWVPATDVDYYGLVDLTTQTAVASGTVFTASATGFINVQFYSKVTTAATTSSVLGPFSLTYTDPDTTVVTLTDDSTSGNSLTSVVNGNFPIYVASGSTVKYSMAYSSSGATAMQYNLHIKAV